MDLFPALLAIIISGFAGGIFSFGYKAIVQLKQRTGPFIFLYGLTYTIFAAVGILLIGGVSADPIVWLFGVSHGVIMCMAILFYIRIIERFAQHLLTIIHLQSSFRWYQPSSLRSLVRLGQRNRVDAGRDHHIQPWKRALVQVEAPIFCKLAAPCLALRNGATIPWCMKAATASQPLYLICQRRRHLLCSVIRKEDWNTKGLVVGVLRR